MITVLLGLDEAIKEYAKKKDIKEIVYWPEISTHTSEIPLWIAKAKTEQPEYIITQNKELLDALLASDLELRIVTVFINDDKLYSRSMTKDRAIILQKKMGMDIRC